MQFNDLMGYEGYLDFYIQSFSDSKLALIETIKEQEDRKEEGRVGRNTQYPK